MKDLNLIIIWILCVICSTSCVGQKEDILPSNVKLMANKESVQLGKGESVSFQVLFDGLDVTEECELYVMSEGQLNLLEGVVFIPSEPGVYQFYAKYKGVETKVVEIQVFNENIVPQGDFLRKVLITKFTATWCVNCPKMSDAIQAVKDELPNRVIDMAVHYIDEFEVDEGKALSKFFSVTAIPVTIVNMDAQAQTSISSSTLLMNYVDEMMKDEFKASGIRLDTYIKENLLNVDVEMTFAEEGEYKLAVAIVQDEIQKSQTGGSSDYIHHSVLRGMLQEDTHGEYLGKQSDSEVLTLTYQYPIEKLDEKGKYRIIAYLLNKDEDGIYRVNNVTSCAIKESVGYQYETSDSK